MHEVLHNLIAAEIHLLGPVGDL